jgi:hypothetical protein
MGPVGRDAWTAQWLVGDHCSRSCAVGRRRNSGRAIAAGALKATLDVKQLHSKCVQLIKVGDTDA